MLYEGKFSSRYEQGITKMDFDIGSLISKFVKETKYKHLSLILSWVLKRSKFGRKRNP